MRMPVHNIFIRRANRQREHGNTAKPAIIINEVLIKRRANRAGPVISYVKITLSFPCRPDV